MDSIDPVLLRLDEARAAYLAVCGDHEQSLTQISSEVAQQQRRAEQLAQELSTARAEAEEQRQQRTGLQSQLSTLQAEYARLHKQLLSTQQRARDAESWARTMEQQTQLLTEHLKRIYGAFFRGGVYGLILKACIELTGAGKGMYLLRTPGDDGRFRVKDAYGFHKYPDAEPSPFIERLVEQVFESNDAFLAEDRKAFRGFPPPSEEENFSTAIVAPVVIQDRLNGVIIVADKQMGTFTEEDCRTLLSIGSHASVAIENARLQSELRQTHVTTISVLADAVELKDAYTSGHCAQVARFARRVAREMGMEEQDQQRVYYAALLHDIGKIGVADTILLKAGPLLPEEMALARAHVRFGYDLIAQVPWLGDVAELVLYHHERWDGAGYPDGVPGPEIPLGSRIVGAVDAYCTMITRRPYQAVRSKEDAIAELRRAAGSQFDPQVVERLIQVVGLSEDELDQEEEAFMMRYGVDEDKMNDATQDGWGKAEGAGVRGLGAGDEGTGDRGQGAGDDLH